MSSTTPLTSEDVSLYVIHGGLMASALSVNLIAELVAQAMGASSI